MAQKIDTENGRAKEYKEIKLENMFLFCQTQVNSKISKYVSAENIGIR